MSWTRSIKMFRLVLNFQKIYRNKNEYGNNCIFIINSITEFSDLMIKGHNDQLLTHLVIKIQMVFLKIVVHKGIPAISGE